MGHSERNWTPIRKKYNQARYRLANTPQIKDKEQDLKSSITPELPAPVKGMLVGALRTSVSDEQRRKLVAN